MKTCLKVLLSILLAFFFGCTKSCDKNTDKKPAFAPLKIGTNANFPPFETVNRKGELEGFDIDLGQEIGSRLGRPVEFKEFEFDALILGLQKEQIDLILSGLSITESRLKEIDMIPYQGDPIKHVSLLFWQHALAKGATFEDLLTLSAQKKLSITVQAGHYLEGFLRAMKVPLKTLSGPPEQILDLKYQKSLAAALDEKNAQNIAKEHADLILVTIDLPEDKWDLGNGIGIKKSRTDLSEQIKKVITEMRSDGTIKKLEEKWLKGVGE